VPDYSGIVVEVAPAAYTNQTLDCNSSAAGIDLLDRPLGPAG
jgi:hypothetical protein